MFFILSGAVCLAQTLPIIYAGFKWSAFECAPKLHRNTFPAQIDHGLYAIEGLDTHRSNHKTIVRMDSISSESKGAAGRRNPSVPKYASMIEKNCDSTISGTSRWCPASKHDR